MPLFGTAGLNGAHILFRGRITVVVGGVELGQGLPDCFDVLC